MRRNAGAAPTFFGLAGRLVPRAFRIAPQACPRTDDLAKVNARIPPVSAFLLRHDAAHARAFDKAVEDDEQGFLIFVGKLIDFAEEPVRLRLSDLRIRPRTKKRNESFHCLPQ